jgi:hypothetical protein
MQDMRPRHLMDEPMSPTAPATAMTGSELTQRRRSLPQTALRT